MLLTVYGIRDCSINLNVQLSQVISIIGSPAICQTGYNVSLSKVNTRLGVPLLQGSVLGPILFLIYIYKRYNEKSNIWNQFFADDNMIYISSNNSAKNDEILSADLKIMEEWANQWLVAFSPSKSCDMTLVLRGSPESQNLFFFDEPISQVKHHKHLGIVKQQNLKWGTHIDNICATANTKINSRNVNRKTLEILYKSFIRPGLVYSDIVFDNCTKEEQAHIESLHKRAGRIISGAIRGTSSNAIFTELGWENMQHRRQQHKCLFYHDNINGNAPQYLIDDLPGHARDRTRYNLRNRDDSNLYNCKTKTFKSYFFPSTTKFWNNLDESIRSIESKSGLKAKLSKVIAPVPPYYYSGRRKINITLARIRMHCSELHQHLADMHIIENNLCACGQPEATEQFFFTCPLYQDARHDMQRSFIDIQVDLNLQIILQGHPTENENLVQIVDTFLSRSKRFSIFLGLAQLGGPVIPGNKLLTNAYK